MPHSKSDRRQFLSQTGTAALLAAAGQAWTPSRSTGQDAPASKSADQFIPGKDRRLIAHNTKVGEIETPLPLLRERRVTPKELLFVRTNQFLTDSLSLEPAPLDGWTIEITGLVNATQRIAATELAKLPRVEHEAVLQCSGNSRSFFARAAKPDGVPWRHGAMGNVRVAGVSLRTVLEHFRVQVHSDAKFVAAEGADSPEKPGAPDFEHSVPLADALDRSLLVTELNGERLPRVHGGPVRFFTLGYYGTMQVKWLNRIRFEAAESNNYHHVGRYRTPLKPLPPGSKFTSTLDNSEPNWGMKIKSVIFSPLVDEMVAGDVTIRGVAWNDGAAKIDTVQVSVDNGRTWRNADLMPGSGPFAWQHWSLKLTLPRGSQRVQSRAIDALGRAQPLDGAVAWNPAGYAWNGVDEVTFVVV